MNHKTKSFIAVLLALCLMLSLGVGALADLNVVDPTPENIPGVTFGDPNTLTNTDPSKDPGADDKENNEPQPDQKGPYTITVNVTPADAGTVRVSGQGVTTDEDGKITANRGAYVFLTVKPNGDYTVTASSDDDDCKIAQADYSSNQFSFLMPSNNVTIDVNLTSSTEGEGDPATHTITVSVPPTESGTVNCPTTANTGDTVDFTVKPAVGYVLEKFETSQSLSADEITINYETDPIQCSFTMPDDDVTISAIFKEQDASDDGGHEGDDGGGNSGGGDPAGDPAGNPTITIKAEPAEGGTVTVEGYEVVDNKFTATPKTDVYFTIKAAPGYKFNNSFTLTGEDAGTFDPAGPGRYSLYVPETDIGITVNFEKDTTKYAINIDENITHGTVETYPAGPTAGGTAVTLTATPDEGYELGSISVTEDGSGTPVTVNDNEFTMPNSAVNVTATFTEKQPQTHRVYVDAPHADFYSAGGSDYAEGAVVSFTVTPHWGYRVTGVWAGAAKLAPNSDGSYSFSMPGADITVKVECERVWWPGYDHWHSIDASYDGDYGYVTVDSWAYVGNTVYFTVHPYYDSWYYYDYSVGVYTDGGVKLDVGHYAGDTWYFTMPNDDVTVYAWFDWYHGDYSVSKSVEGDGSIYVRSWADHGDKVWIDAVPQSGASLTSLNVYYKGGSWWYESLHGYYGRWYEVDVHYDSARGEYYFYMPAHDVVVEAVFTTVGESITVVKPDNGSLKLSTLRAEKGDLVYITVDPDKGYELSELEVLSSLGKNVEVTELSENYYVFRMPGLNVKVKAEFRLSAYTPFADVSPNAWYFEAVSFVYDRGLMEGTSNYAFSPDADLSRGMLAAILYRMAGSPEVSGYSTFGDVPTTAYYARAIAWAQDHGIVTGVSAESYKPDSPVTREQLVAILSRYAQYKGYETSVSYDYLSTYGDASSASAYAREALNWAVARGVIDGQSGGVLAPTATASRAEVAQVLMNYLAVYA